MRLSIHTSIARAEEPRGESPPCAGETRNRLSPARAGLGEEEEEEEGFASAGHELSRVCFQTWPVLEKGPHWETALPSLWKCLQLNFPRGCLVSTGAPFGTSLRAP